MGLIFIVRHAMPTVDAELGPCEWALSAKGESAARALRGRLPEDSRRVASGERKAQQTLQLALDGTFEIDERLNEVHRPAEPVGADVRSPRRAWVSGQPDSRHSGWETPTEAAERFDAVVRTNHSGHVLVASHGMVLTAWLVSIKKIDAGEAAARFWETLAFPDIVTVQR